jgi:hypothetical protein
MDYFGQPVRILVIGSGTIVIGIGEQGEHSEMKIRETPALNREEDCKKLFRILKRCASFDDHSENFSDHFGVKPEHEIGNL